METQSTYSDPSSRPVTPAPSQEEPRPPRSDRALAGLIVVAVGGALLARQFGIDLPYWLFSWPMLLIVIGFYIGARHSFREMGWLIPVAIGVVFIADDFVRDVNLTRFFWPVLIIVIGLMMIFRSKKHFCATKWQNRFGSTGTQDSENQIECVTFFGGVRKNIISKDFKGGEAITIFGGTELNLMQADTTDKIQLELVQVFGGTKLIIPPHWKVQTEELVTIFGGLNDKRPLPAAAHDEGSRVLVLKGTCVFGGIDIKSF